MLPGIALMIGAYCIARLLLTWNKPQTQGREQGYRLAVTLLATLAILVGFWHVTALSLRVSTLDPLALSGAATDEEKYPATSAADAWMKAYEEYFDAVTKRGGE